MIPSGIINGDGDYVTDGFDVGRVAIGQGGLEGEVRAGPLQMAEVAAAVANGGRLMKPQLTDRIVRKDGRVKERIQPDLQSVVMKPETADELANMMSRVVEEGTGTAAALAGIRVAGQDGHRRDRAEPRVHPGLVHLLRARRESAHGGGRDGSERCPGRAARWRRRSPSRCSRRSLGGGAG